MRPLPSFSIPWWCLLSLMLSFNLDAQIRHGIFIDGGRSFALRDGSTADYFGYELIVDGPNQGQKRDINSHLASGWQFSGGYQLFLGERWNLALGMFLVRGENSFSRNILHPTYVRSGESLSDTAIYASTLISSAKRQGAFLNVSFDLIPFYPYPKGRFMKDFALSLTVGGQVFNARIDLEESSHITDTTHLLYFESARNYPSGVGFGLSAGLEAKYRLDDHWQISVGALYTEAIFEPSRLYEERLKTRSAEYSRYEIENFIRRRIPFNHISSYCRLSFIF